MRYVRCVVLGCLLLFGCNIDAETRPPQEQSAIVQAPASHSPTTQKKCIFVWDAKLGKEVEKCRTMVVHQKIDNPQSVQKPD